MVIEGTQSFQTVDFLTQTSQKMESSISDFFSKCDVGNYGFGHIY